jgi:hypothetical protein
MESIVRFAIGEGVLGVHLQAMGTTIELRSSHAYKLEEGSIETSRFHCLAEAAHCAEDLWVLVVVDSHALIPSVVQQL